MKQFKGFVIKEFYHIFRDYRTMIILFGMPVLQILLFGFVIKNEIKDVNIAILDYSRDEVSLEISNKIVSSGFFRLVDNLSDQSEIDEIFKGGKAKEVIIFEKNFAQKLEREKSASIQIIADGSDPNTANQIVKYTSSILQDYIKDYNSGISPAIIIQPEVRMYYNKELRSAFMFVPGTMALILMLLSAMMTSISIAREKELGTMEVLLVSPLKPIQIVLGKVVPYFVLSFINTIVIIAMGVFIFGVPVQGSFILLMAESMLFILMALSLGILISTVAKTQQIAMMMSMFALMLPTMLLSGFIFPIKNMPEILQYVSILMPPRWFIVIIKNIMLKGTGLAFVWQETLIILGMTSFFIMMSVRKFKIRLE